MRTFDYTKLKDISWDSQIISYIAEIQEYKGKQELYIRQKPMELKRLVEIAKIQSTEASNRIEGIVTTEARLKQLVADKTTPRNRDEKEILGYRNVLNIIHESYAYIPLTANYILQLHRDMLKFTELSYGGMFKTTPNEIAATLPDGTKRVLFKPLEPYETPAAVEAACRSFNECLEKELVSPLLLIPYFIVDFLCIHPFNDGNGRMSRLLTLLLLYRSGYMVGRYISIEKAIADTKENYYDALYASDQNWLAEKNNPLPFIKYMLGVILACYRDFERRITISTAVGQKSTAYDIVKVYIDNKLGSFTKQEVLKNCPSIGKASVEAALKRLVEEHYIEKIGAGRSTCYARK
jgi:Fic family protein